LTNFLIGIKISIKVNLFYKEASNECRNSARFYREKNAEARGVVEKLNTSINQKILHKFVKKTNDDARKVLEGLKRGGNI
jgi:arsenate reductase-like glutaredoxin family protein